MDIRKATISDIQDILGLYNRVARIPGGLARLEDEIDAQYIEGFLSKSLESGLVYVAFSEKAKLVGEIHAYTPRLYCFSHVLSDLTIVVDPEAQRMGVGRAIFEQR